MAKNPATVTIYGRLSYPVFRHSEAVSRNAGSMYPQSDPNKVAPEFNILVEEGQLKKLTKHINDVFLPHCEAQFKAGEKRNALAPKDIKKLKALMDSEDWEDQPPYIPIKVVSEKTAALAPEAAASVKVKGMNGQDVVLKAIVNDEDELDVPDADLLTFPVIRPIEQTVHTMYSGCLVAATLNLYAFVASGMPGISASAGTCVFKADADSFGGGIDVDEDEIFMD